MEGELTPEPLGEEGFADLSRRIERTQALARGELHPLDR
jgi:hypothetical protein